MSRVPPLAAPRLPVLPGLLCALGVGCGPSGSHLKLIAFQDPHFPEHYDVRPDECVYRSDGAGDYHIVGRASSRPRADAPAVEQIFHLHVFWRPRPGKTYDHPSLVDAVVRYAITSRQGSAVYRGAGYAYPSPSRWSDELTVKLESATVTLAAQRGDAPELLGQAHVLGTLIARNDPSRAVELMREIERLDTGTP